MKKRRTGLWISTALLIAALASLYFYPVTVRRGIVVPLGTDRATSYLQNPGLVKLWLYPFAETDSPMIHTRTDPVRKIMYGDAYAELIPLSLLSANLKLGNQKRNRLFNFFVIPDSVNAYHSLVTMTYTTTLLKNWLGLDPLQKNAEKSLDHLRNLLHDTKKVYGFKIEKILVEDTAFLFLKKTVADGGMQQGMEAVFKTLLQYAEEKNAGYNGVRIFHFIRQPDNEIDLFAGIGVTRRIETPAEEPIQYKMMPGGKNLLAADFEGPYYEVENVYQALDIYKKDNGLLSMAIPFQKFISEGYAFADSQIVKISVRYPVY